MPTYSSVLTGLSPSAWWRLGEPSGTTAADASGHSHPGTYAGTYTLGVPGLVNDSDTAISLAGVASSGMTATVGSVGTGDYTWLMWLKRSSSLSSIEVTMYAMGLGWVGIDASKVPRCAVGETITGTTNLCDGQPHLLAVTRSGSTVTLWTDNGFSEGTGSDSTSGNGNVELGALAGGFNFAGVLDEAAVWTSTALSQGQIQSIWSAGTSSPSLTSGTASTSSSGSTIATVTCGAATGGTAPYTYQWKRSTTSGSGYSNVSGATSLTLNDTGLTNGTTYYYVLVSTDSAGTPATVTSNQTSATPAAGPQTIAVTDSHVFWSPGGWDSSGNGSGTMQANGVYSTSTWARTANPGNYVKVTITSAGSGYLKVNLGTTMLNGLTAGSCPKLRYFCNNIGEATGVLLAYSGSTVQVTLQTGLSAGTYEFTLFFEGQVQPVVGDRYTDLTTAASCVKITGFEIDGASSLASPTLRTKRAVIYGDSITEGVAAGSTGLQDATRTYAHLLAQAFDCEIGIVAFGGQGYTATGVGNVPVLSTSFDHYSSGRSRLVGGVFPYSLDYVFVNEGTNDGSGIASDVTIMLGNLRAAAPLAKLVQVIPSGQWNASDIISGYNMLHASDSNMALLDAGSDLTAGGFPPAQGGGRINNSDQFHLTAAGHGVFGTVLAQKFQSALGVAGSAVFAPIGCGFIKGV